MVKDWSGPDPPHGDSLVPGKIPSRSRLGAGSTISCLLSLSGPASAVPSPSLAPCLPRGWQPSLGCPCGRLSSHLSCLGSQWTTHRRGSAWIGTPCLGAGQGLVATPSFFLSSLRSLPGLQKPSSSPFWCLLGPGSRPQGEEVGRGSLYRYIRSSNSSSSISPAAWPGACPVWTQGPGTWRQGPLWHSCSVVPMGGPG